MKDLGVGYGQGYLFGRPAPEMTPAKPTELSHTLTAAAAARGDRIGGLVNRR
jgi:EAL domain-containing protein (putative c-di-GMP-specific phosphodiesterase class I)